MEPAAVFRLTPIRFTARSLTWPSRGPATLQLSAGTPEGGTIETQGTVVLDPVRFDLRTRLVNIAVAPYRAYAPLAAKVEGHVEGDLTAKGTVGGGKTELSAKGSLALADLAFIDGDKPIGGPSQGWPARLPWPATATTTGRTCGRGPCSSAGPRWLMPITGILTPRARARRLAPAPAPPVAPSPPPRHHRPRRRRPDIKVTHARAASKKAAPPWWTRR